MDTTKELFQQEGYDLVAAAFEKLELRFGIPGD